MFMKNRVNMIRVWDPVVRIGHWTLVIAFFVAYFTEDDYLTQHAWAGYLVGLVVAFRLLWGFVGSRHARFSDFVPSPSTFRGYMRDMLQGRAKRFLGHNPAGGAMIVALLISLSGTVISGLVLYAIEDQKGPLAGWVASDTGAVATPSLISAAVADDDDDDDDDERKNERGEEFWEETHEIFANLTLFLVGLHIAGVLFSSLAHKENLIRSMFTGQKPRLEEQA
jgi:cytochrome b